MRWGTTEVVSMSREYGFLQEEHGDLKGSRDQQRKQVTDEEDSSKVEGLWV